MSEQIHELIDRIADNTMDAADEYAACDDALKAMRALAEFFRAGQSTSALHALRIAFSQIVQKSKRL